MIWTDRARADLDDIWQYTERKWGAEQAELYLAQLNASFADADTRKLRARPIDFARPGWFRMRHVRHFIYFHQDDEVARVLRVLHDSMDETLHLP